MLAEDRKLFHHEVRLEVKRQTKLIKEAFMGRWGVAKLEALENYETQVMILRGCIRRLQEEIDFSVTTRYSHYYCAIVNDLIKSTSEYPSVPPPSAEASPGGQGVPSEPGIYFIWKDNVVVYVGQSDNMRHRLKLSAHAKLKRKDKISFLTMDKYWLTWAENYYIGILQPVRNYGDAASHNKRSRPEGPIRSTHVIIQEE